MNDIKRCLSGVAAALALTFSSPAVSEEADFLKSVAGNWTGDGTVKVRTNSSPVNVTCKFKSGSTETSLTLNGNCRGFLIVSRVVNAKLKIDEGKYSGSYVGAGTGTAGLSGIRKGNTINLRIRWAKKVNGDRSPQMSIQKVGDQGMRLTTVDTDPATGKRVVTSQINLRRQ